MASGNDKKEPTSSFTVDGDATGVVDMPSVTRLLNRKKLGLSSPPKTPSTQASPLPQTTSPAPASDLPPALDQPKVEAPFPISPQPNPGEIALSLTESGTPFELQSSGGPAEEVSSSGTPPPSRGSASRVQQARLRSERRIPQKMTLWDSHQLKSGPDPLGRGLALLLDRGVSEALFLSITAPPQNSPVPHFTSTAAIGSAAKLQIWTGLKWDPSVVPEMWNLFVRAGFVELSPPGASTHIKSNRNVIRLAFGVKSNEWLMLVRTGPSNDCRGVLALIADRSLLTEIAFALPLLNAPAPASSMGKKSA